MPATKTSFSDQNRGRSSRSSSYGFAPHACAFSDQPLRPATAATLLQGERDINRHPVLATVSNTPPHFIIELEPVRGGPPPEIRLRLFLKTALRRHGLRCVDVKEIQPPAEPAKEKAMSDTLFEQSISEDRSEIRRGRPARFDAKWLSIIGCIWPELKSYRGRMNRAYATRAIKVVKTISDHAWLYDATSETIRWGYLELLGRIDDSELVSELAKWICEERPPVDRVRDVISLLPTGVA